MENSVVHFEIPVEDMKRAETFYKTVFNWEIHSIPEMEYTIVRTAPTDEKTRMLKQPGTINGGMMARNDCVTSPVITINVKDIKQACHLLEKHGGEVVREPFVVGDMGIAAYFRDTEGNVIGLWQTTKSY